MREDRDFVRRAGEQTNSKSILSESGQCDHFPKIIDLDQKRHGSGSDLRGIFL